MQTLRTLPGAIGLAVLLALVTLPLTVAGIGLAGSQEGDTRPTVGLLSAAALFAVVCAAVAGGRVARAVPATSSTGRLVAAVFVSWPVAIIALPVVPALLGERAEIFVGTGFGSISSSDAGSGLRLYLWALPGLVYFLPAFLAFGAATLALKWLAGSRRALSGAGVLLAALGASLAAAGVAAVGWRWPLPVVLAAGAALWAPVLWLGWRRRALRPATLLAFGATLAAVNGMSIFEAPVPFVVLVVGAAVWTLALRRAEGVPGALAPHQRPRPAGA